MDDSHFSQHHSYGAPDFRHQLLTNRPPFPPPHFPADSQAAAELFMSHPTSQHLEIMMMGHRPSGLCEFQAAASVGATGAAARPGGGTCTSVLEAEAGGCVGGDGSNTRWPRQETLTLLEIRSRLDSRFREANQKGPLWDEVSRIMGEENGYQRSGKKCREKFENLYKYYKKTKEGKAGRQDGKNYRFFRQLEALYGDHTSTNAPACILDTQSLANSHPYQPSPIDTQLGCPNYNINQETTTSHDQSQKLCDSLSLSDYSSDDFDTSSSDNIGWGETKLMGESASIGKKRRGRRSWKAKIKEFIDSKMRKVVEKQEAMVEKMMRTLEEKEQERVLREEEWKREEIARVEKEHKFWAQERAWIEARDVALMDALQNLTSKSDQHHLQVVGAINRNIGTKGEGIERIVKKSKEYSSKKSKDDLLSRSCGYYNESDHGNSLYNQGGISYREVNERGHDEVSRVQLNDGSSPSNPNPNNVQESCLRFLMNEGESLWDNYDLKMNKGGED